MHSFGIVICDFTVDDIRETAARLMAPFYSEIEVPKYVVRHPNSYTAKLMTAHRVHTIDELAVALQTDGYGDFFVQDGVVMSYSTHNPCGHWDYYIVGGCYDSCVADEECAEVALARDWDQDVCRNVARPTSIVQAKLPAIVVTPDGRWHDLDDHGWRMMGPDRENKIAMQSWEAFAMPLLSVYTSHIALGIEIHS